ncbi:MAG: hypothetical protein ACXWX6_09460 [Actinomycetota bacterium]
MKACPFCEAELRDSVIRCTRCGRSLIGEPEQVPEEAPARAGAVAGLSGPVVSAGTRGTSVGFPPRDATPPPPAAAWATPTAARTARPPSSQNVLATRRALPAEGRRSGRPDAALWLAALAVLGAAYFAWQSLGEPWVKLVITDTSERLNPELVGDITLRGNAALIGAMGQGLAVVLGVLGLAWLVYGFDRGSTMPAIVNPAISIVAAIAGVFGAVLSATVWFVWEDAAIEHARGVRMTADELRALLDLQPAPLVEIERLAGMMRFGCAMLVGLLAACTAWWAYRKRA